MQTLIVTFWKARNYGAFLQCYALHNTIPNSKVLAYKARSAVLFAERKKKYRYIWPFLHPYWWLKNFINQIREPTFSDWKRIPCQKYKVFKNTRDLSLKYDCIIAGSDQIWNARFVSDEEYIYFAGFASNETRKISYAASLGMPSWPTDFEAKALRLLKNFNSVSVRERSSVEYLQSLGIKNVSCVCDPTILHNGEFYRKKFKIENNRRKYSFIYTIREKLSASIEKLLLDDVVKCSLDGFRIPSVSQWLSYIDNAQFVVTDSFHCCVFCLLFHKPFLILPTSGKKGGMNERFSTLLEKTHLENRIVSSSESYEEAFKKLNSIVDWSFVDATLQKWREESLLWLQKNLTSSVS